MNQQELIDSSVSFKENWEKFSKAFKVDGKTETSLSVERERCFLKPIAHITRTSDKGERELSFSFMDLSEPFENAIAEIIHVPALRGNPRRDYDITSVGPIFPGTFENYVASIISEWQESKNTCLETLFKWLQMLNLADAVSVEPIDDTRAEINVGLCNEDPLMQNNLISIADVGFGVSQTLPVLVALLKAEPNQLVYIEQPEIHLHPRAQVAMARILTEASKRNIRIVVETHSALLLRGIQTIVAKGGIIAPDKVRLHWFERNKDDRTTKITSANLDEAGSYRDWPEDFGDTIIDAETDYILAAESHQMKE